MMTDLLWAGVGAFFGGIVRAWLSAQGNADTRYWQWGTMAANLIGCVLIGVWMGLVTTGRASESASVLVATGFCGGLTTFSTFSLEVHHLLVKHKRKGIAGLYWIGSVIACIACVYLGVMLGQR